MPAPTRTTTLGELLRAARTRTGMTQEQLAGLSTVSVRAIRDLEQGRVGTPRRDTIQLLADAMRLGRAMRAELDSAVDGPLGDRTLLGRRADEVAPPPRPLGPLYGRQEELGALAELLGTRQSRLLTLTGLPGVGKSRLAQELAAVVRDRYDMPTLWVGPDRDRHDEGTGCHPAARPGPEPCRAVMAALTTSTVVHGGDHEELAAAIGDRPALLVLDDYEPQPAGAAGLGSLLTACEGLSVLATTRRSAPLVGGAYIPVQGLLADRLAAGASGDAAVELMLSFVRCRCPGLPLSTSTRAHVGEICRALDGLPRVLEEAADWLLLFSPEQVRDIAVREPLDFLGRGFAEELATALPASGSRIGAALAVLAATPRRWALDTVAVALSATVAEAARTLRALVLRGLVRRVPAPSTGGTEGFEVLNLVRHAVAGRRPLLTVPLERTALPAQDCVVPVDAAMRVELTSVPA